MGPIALDVHYELTPQHGGSRVKASVGVRKARGITGRLVASATGALLTAGALDGAAGRIARAARPRRWPHEPDPHTRGDPNVR